MESQRCRHRLLLPTRSESLECPSTLERASPWSGWRTLSSTGSVAAPGSCHDSACFSWVGSSPLSSCRSGKISRHLHHKDCSFLKISCPHLSSFLQVSDLHSLGSHRQRLVHMSIDHSSFGDLCFSIFDHFSVRLPLRAASTEPQAAALSEVASKKADRYSSTAG